MINKKWLFFHLAFKQSGGMCLQKLHVVKSESLQGTDNASGWLTKISDKRT